MTYVYHQTIPRTENQSLEFLLRFKQVCKSNEKTDHRRLQSAANNMARSH